MGPSEIAVFLVIVGLAAALQAVTGFGFGLLALGILGSWMDLREASVHLAPAGLAMNAFLFFRLRQHFSWSGLVPLFVAGLLTVPLGAWLLLHMQVRVLEGLLAAVMLFSAAQGLRVSVNPPRVPWPAVRAGVPCGVLGGLLTGTFGVGGPPVVMYLLNRPLNRFQFVVSMQALFGLSAAVRVAQFVWVGRLDRGHLPVVLPAIAVAILGVWGGLHLLHRLSDRLVRQTVLWFVAACGLRYLCAALL